MRLEMLAVGVEVRELQLIEPAPQPPADLPADPPEARPSQPEPRQGPLQEVDAVSIRAVAGRHGTQAASRRSAERLRTSSRRRPSSSASSSARSNSERYRCRSISGNSPVRPAG